MKRLLAGLLVFLAGCNPQSRIKDDTEQKTLLSIEAELNNASAMATVVHNELDQAKKNGEITEKEDEEFQAALDGLGRAVISFRSALSIYHIQPDKMALEELKDEHEMFVKAYKKFLLVAQKLMEKITVPPKEKGVPLPATEEGREATA